MRHIIFIVNMNRNWMKSMYFGPPKISSPKPPLVLLNLLFSWEKSEAQVDWRGEAWCMGLHLRDTSPLIPSWTSSLTPPPRNPFSPNIIPQLFQAQWPWTSTALHIHSKDETCSHTHCPSSNPVGWNRWLPSQWTVPVIINKQNQKIYQNWTRPFHIYM